MVDLALHGQDGPVPLQVLAEEQQIPQRYLGKIVQDLRRSGLIRSIRGAHGGYMLNAPPAETTLLDVWEALEGPLCPVECLEAPEACRMEPECVTREVWREVQEALKEVLDSQTLQKLADRYDRKTR
jgi:Rrf2 family protein